MFRSHVTNVAAKVLWKWKMGLYFEGVKLLAFQFLLCGKICHIDDCFCYRFSTAVLRFLWFSGCRQGSHRFLIELSLLWCLGNRMDLCTWPAVDEWDFNFIKTRGKCWIIRCQSATRMRRFGFPQQSEQLPELSVHIPFSSWWQLLVQPSCQIKR